MWNEFTWKLASEIEPSNIKWFMSDFLAQGVTTLISGQSGMGKSTLVYKLMAEMTTEAIPHTVLYLSTENSPSLLVRPGLDAAGAALREVRVLDPLTGSDGVQFSLAHHMDHLRGAIDEYGATVVILDTVLPLITLESNNDDKSVERALTPFRQMCMEYKMIGLGVCHMNKSKNTENVDRVAGSYQWVSQFGIVTSLTKNIDTEISTWEVIKSNVGFTGTRKEFETVISDGRPIVKWV